MKRKIAILLTLSLMVGVVGCQKETPVTSENGTEVATTENSVAVNDSEEVTEEQESTSTEEKEEKEEKAKDKVTVSYESKNDDRYNDDGEVILYVYYSKPVVTIEGNEDASKAIAENMQTQENDFFTNCETMETEARMAFEDGFMEDMPGYANEVRYQEKRVDDKVVSFVRNSYSNTGGVHGNNYVFGQNFDVETGAMLTLEDISEDKDAFMNEVREYVLQLCESEQYKDRLFPEYKDNIDFILQDDLWFFGREGITFISNVYELAAYAEGTMYFTVPYEMLSYLKAEYTYEGGFVKGMKLGENISIDLNGDGVGDEMTFDVEESSDYTYVPKLTINGADYSAVFEENQCYFAYPYEEYVILDIDDSDDYFEIAVQDYGMSDDPATHFFKYDGSNVIYLGSVNDRISDLYIVNDGSGSLQVRERMAIFETVNAKFIYDLENDKLTRNVSSLHPVAYEDSSSQKGTLQDLYVFADMSTDSEVIKVEKGELITVLATDNAEWVQIETEDGTICYIHVVEYCNIDMNGNVVDIYEVLTPVILAG